MGSCDKLTLVEESMDPGRRSDEILENCLGLSEGYRESGIEQSFRSEMVCPKPEGLDVGYGFCGLNMGPTDGFIGCSGSIPSCASEDSLEGEIESAIGLVSEKTLESEHDVSAISAVKIEGLCSENTRLEGEGVLGNLLYGFEMALQNSNLTISTTVDDEDFENNDSRRVDGSFEDKFYGEMSKACTSCNLVQHEEHKDAMIIDGSSLEKVEAEILTKISAELERSRTRVNDETTSSTVADCPGPPRRSTRVSKPIIKPPEEKPGRNVRRTTQNKRKACEPIDLLATTVRRKRSCLATHTRSSTWGLPGTISQIFDQNIGLNNNRSHNKVSRKASGRTSKSREVRSRGSKGVFSSTSMQMKIEFGKEVQSSSMKAVISNVVDSLPPIRTKMGDYGPELYWEVEPGISKVDDGIKDKFEEERLRIQWFKCSNVTSEKSKAFAEASVMDAQLSDKYLEAGTSPDSEVINLIPEAQVGAPVEDLHESILISSKALVADAYVTSSRPRKKGKKGNSKEDGLFDIGNTKKSRSLVKVKDESCESSISPTSRIVSSNVSSSEGFSREQIGLPSEALKMECDTETHLTSGPDAGLGPSEFRLSEKSNGREFSGFSKTGSEVPHSVRSHRDASADEHKVTKNEFGDPVGCEVANCLQTENNVVTDIGKPISWEMSSMDMSGLEMGPNAIGGQCLPTRDAWVCCDDCHKWRCISATLADSIEETNCKWTCSDNLDRNFADCSIPQEMSNGEINDELGISYASCDEDAYDVHFNEFGERQLMEPQKSPWMLIKSNLFLHRSCKTQAIDEVMVCHCKPSSEGRFGCGDECLNRMLNIECVRGTCPCGERCSNQQFQKRKYANLQWFRCGKKGYGLQSLENVSEGQFLIEYIGEVLDLHAYEARQREYASMGHKHFYFMTLNGSEVIDACAKGNLGRFINHSCDPNCRTEKWMVNGEVCIGLFAIRNIKKGEELTFDYNYVRVFGAAAKKCFCGSPHCRGYIGGDPHNTEGIVQCDSDEEYPEPVMIGEDGLVAPESLENVNVTSTIPSSDSSETPTTLIWSMDIDKPGEAKAETEKTGTGKTETEIAVVNSEIITEKDETLVIAEPSVSESRVSFEMDDAISVRSPRVEQDMKSLSVDQEEINTQKDLNKFESSIQPVEEHNTEDQDSSKQPSPADPADPTKKSRGSMKSRTRVKTSHSSLVKKGKSSNNQVSPNKPKKPMEVSVDGHFEASRGFSFYLPPKKYCVEVKLNDLLDGDGGISKRKDAAKGYLKLLLLTAASGDSVSGEGIQSTRDLSMILDALLKTKSKTVLVDIVNKNGLRMLHNLMKKNRSDFNKTPILRKLLKVFDYLATRHILTLEHITGGPPCPGMETLRESILSLTEHNDRQVFQSARSFRDTWIPRPVRRNFSIERDEARIDFHRDNHRFSVSHNRWRDHGTRHSEAIDVTNQAVLATPSVDPSVQDGFSVPFIANTRIRKRKSRWGPPQETNLDSYSSQNSVQKPESNLENETRESSDSFHEDVPPGFSPSCHIMHSREVASGIPKVRFNSRMPVSHGIPLPLVHQYGTPETPESWAIAPGIPFHPFPPLPPYPRGGARFTNGYGPGMGHRPGNTFRPKPPNMVGHMPKPFRHPMGRRFFRQQKWNNNSQPPWIRRRKNWVENDDFNGPHGSFYRHPHVEGDGFNGPHNNSFYRHPHHQNQY